MHDCHYGKANSNITLASHFFISSHSCTRGIEIRKMLRELRSQILRYRHEDVPWGRLRQKPSVTCQHFLNTIGWKKLDWLQRNAWHCGDGRRTCERWNGACQSCREGDSSHRQSWQRMCGLECAVCETHQLRHMCHKQILSYMKCSEPEGVHSTQQFETQTRRDTTGQRLQWSVTCFFFLSRGCVLQ